MTHILQVHDLNGENKILLQEDSGMTHNAGVRGEGHSLVNPLWGLGATRCGDLPQLYRWCSTEVSWAWLSCMDSVGWILRTGMDVALIPQHDLETDGHFDNGIECSLVILAG